MPTNSHELVVIDPLRDVDCVCCGARCDLLKMEDPGPRCLSCADLDHLVFLPTGNAVLTRRAKKASGLWAVVVRFSRARKRYERQGVLVEHQALAEAEESCLADVELRARRAERDAERRAVEDEQFTERFAAAIHRAFPRCPAERAQLIARHAAVRGSCRVGRSAGARKLEEEAIELAVVASVRHNDTLYDSLLMAGICRADARAQVRGEIAAIMAAWRGGQ